MPEDDFITHVHDLSLYLEFSADPDRTSVEENFIFQEKDLPVRGRYLWEERRMYFIPQDPIHRNSSYSITLSTGAEDCWGNSLKETFYHTFRTTRDSRRPVLISTIPDNNTHITDPLHQVSFTFSEPVDFESFLSAFSITPKVTGFLTQDEDLRSCRFFPGEEYLWQQEYVIEISESLRDTHGNQIPFSETLRFTLGDETVPPEITFAGTESEDRHLLSLESPGTVNDAWEADGSIKIIFSEPVSPETVENAVSIAPAWDHSFQYDNEKTPVSVLLLGREKFVYSRTYTLMVDTTLTDLQGNRLKEPETYCFSVTGPRSRPPEIVRCTMLADPVSGAVIETPPFSLISLENYFPSSESRDCFFDIYIRFALGSGPDILSFCENFSITATNFCAELVPSGIEIEDLINPLPDPPADTLNNERIIRVHADVLDDPDKSGVIRLILDDDFHDSSGNSMAEIWSRTLIK